MRRLWTVLFLVACGPEASIPPASGRCAEITELLTQDPEPPVPGWPIVPLMPWPTNTAGDDRLELWYFEPAAGDALAMAGYAPGEGQYHQAWSFTRRGALQSFHLDFTGDGYADLLMSTRGEEEPYERYYFETQPDGTIGEVAVSVPMIQGEERTTWRDIDRDGVLDRVASLDGEFVWISGVDEIVHELALPAPEDAALSPLPGDTRLWAFSSGDPGSTALIRIASAGHELLSEARPLSFLKGSRVHGDHIDVIEARSEDGEPPWDLALVRLDPTGRLIDERVVAEQIHGWLRQDYDGDGERDLIFEAPGGHVIAFGDADDEHSDPEPLPTLLKHDQGIMQSFDVDADERVELLLALVDDDGRVQWQALGWGSCP